MFKVCNVEHTPYITNENLRDYLKKNNVKHIVYVGKCTNDIRIYHTLENEFIISTPTGKMLKGKDIELECETEFLEAKLQVSKHKEFLANF